MIIYQKLCGLWPVAALRGLSSEVYRPSSVVRRPSLTPQAYTTKQYSFPARHSLSHSQQRIYWGS